MSSLTDLPNPSTFGESFNYAVWTPNTQIELCNVPWNSDYRDIVDFDTQAALDAYLNGVAGPKVLIGKMTLARAGDPIRINLPFAACYKYNYLRVNNGVSPVTAHYTDYNDVERTVNDSVKTLYYFIQDVTYLAPNTTQLTVMLDVWQTFGREIQFGNCYIERGHIGVANENQFNNKGRDYLTVPEALDVGPEYNINETYHLQIPNNESGELGVEETSWIVIGIGADITSDPGDTSNPHLSTTVNFSQADGLPNGFDLLYFKSIQDFQFFIALYSDTPWITQTIMFITVIPPIYSDDPTKMSLTEADKWTPSGYPEFHVYRLTSDGALKHQDMLAHNFRDAALAMIPDRYQSLKKFLTAPFMFLELTTYNGAPLMMRPELIPSDSVYVDIYQHSAPPSPRWAIVPSHYNATGMLGGSDDGEFLDFATFITNFPQFTVLNNNYLEYLGANRNSIAYSYASADWSQQKALQGASTDYWNTERGITNSQNQAYNQVLANNALTHVGNISRVAGGVAGIGEAVGRGVANPGAAAIGGVSAGADAAVGVARASAENSIRNNQINQSNQSQNAYTQDVASRNYDYAKYAAKGDYHNAINAIQARVQDAKLIQPSSVGQLGGESFIATVLNGDISTSAGWRVYVKIKQVSPGYMAIIGEYWLRYGYAINRFSQMPNSLRCMSKFTYWKLKETYVIASQCPEVFKQTIRGIFEKGVTVWVTPTDIGTIDLATNEPLAGITL